MFEEDVPDERRRTPEELLSSELDELRAAEGELRLVDVLQ